MLVGKAKMSILNEYLALRSITAAPWFVFCTERQPALCLLRVLDDQARLAVYTVTVVRDGDCVQRTRSWSSVNRMYDSKA